MGNNKDHTLAAVKRAVKMFRSFEFKTALRIFEHPLHPEKLHQGDHQIPESATHYFPFSLRGQRGPKSNLHIIKGYSSPFPQEKKEQLADSLGNAGSCGNRQRIDCAGKTAQADILNQIPPREKISDFEPLFAR